MILVKGVINLSTDRIMDDEYQEAISHLKDGEYGFIIFDKKTNKLLPILKYLNGVVLKGISDALPRHPPVEALYRFFENKFCSDETCIIDDDEIGEIHYRSLKSLPTAEIAEIIDQIILFAKEKWGVDLLSRKDLKEVANSEPYLDAYANSWTDTSRTV